MMEKTNAIEEKKSDVYKYKVKNMEDNNRTYINNIDNINSQSKFESKVELDFHTRPVNSP